jgi:4-diphosphocytidyl-2-C-methyl-D-erythritol kinase
MSRTSNQPALILEAPAKINLHLRVIGRRPDGYHELVTVMQRLELSDRLELKPAAAGVHLSCPGSALPCNNDNLVFRAAAIYLAMAGIGTGIEIVLHKQIPVAAGLGGGSSDAAAVLLGLNSIFAPGLPETALLQLAGTLGADVPFFVAGMDAALATGIGDRLQPAAPLQGCRVLLVNPGFPVSTRWVYENFALTMPGNPYMLGREQNHLNYIDFLASSEPLPAVNDLESVTIGRFPELGEIKETMLASGAGVALMSGSGPTVFGLFREETLAVDCYDRFLRRYPHNVFLTKPRHVL